MLEELSIQGIGVIESARMQFDPGFTVITGETGAGKTMILTGLGLLLGERAEPTLVRKGHDLAQVEAILTAPDSGHLAALAEGAGGSLEDGALLAGRVVPASGRSRATLAGRAVPTAQLAEALNSRLTVHGQSDQLRLRSQVEQRAALDALAGTSAPLAEYRQAFEHWRATLAALADWEADSRRNEQERILLSAGLEAIDALAPQSGEDDELRATANRLANVEDLRAAVEQALHALGAEDTGAAALVARAQRSLEAVAAHGPEFAPWAEALGQAGSMISEVLNDLGAYREGLEADPGALEAIHERRAALATLARSWGPTLDDVIVWATNARARLTELDSQPATRAAHEAAVAQANAAVEALAAQITKQRTAAAGNLVAAVNAELAGLAMKGATFGIAIEPVAPGPTGADEVAMTLSAHPGATPLPVARSASGGELSRIMLALELCLAPQDGEDLTLVFDEVDAGIGGAAALEIGARLARLAQRHQVIVVTHLAQVAAFAGRHVVVEKEISTTDAVSAVREVSGEERVGELARMLSGDDSPAARRHAAQLLQRSRANMNM